MVGLGFLVWDPDHYQPKPYRNRACGTSSSLGHVYPDATTTSTVTPDTTVAATPIDEEIQTIATESSVVPPANIEPTIPTQPGSIEI